MSPKVQKIAVWIMLIGIIAIPVAIEIKLPINGMNEVTRLIINAASTVHQYSERRERPFDFVIFSQACCKASLNVSCGNTVIPFIFLLFCKGLAFQFIPR